MKYKKINLFSTWKLVTIEENFENILDNEILNVQKNIANTFVKLNTFDDIYKLIKKDVTKIKVGRLWYYNDFFMNGIDNNHTNKHNWKIICQIYICLINVFKYKILNKQNSEKKIYNKLDMILNLSHELLKKVTWTPKTIIENIEQFTKNTLSLDTIIQFIRYISEVLENMYEWNYIDYNNFIWNIYYFNEYFYHIIF